MLKRKSKRRKNLQRIKQRTVKIEDSDSQSNVTFESEYKDLVDMKKYLTEKLHEKPKSKTLLKSLNECKDSNNYIFIYHRKGNGFLVNKENTESILFGTKSTNNKNHNNFLTSISSCCWESV